MTLVIHRAGRLLAERGYAGMELRDVAERGDAPRGSIYHHFPGGKAQLAAGAAALEGGPGPHRDRTLAGRARAWAIAAALEREGVDSGKAATFAAMMISTIEGALVRTRAAGDLGPLDSAIAGLEQALDGLIAASG